MWRSARLWPATWRCLPVLLIAGGLGTACVPGGPLDVDGGDERVAEDGGSGDGSSGSGDITAPSIVGQAVAGTNTNPDSASSASLPYDHPGGRLIVFARHNGPEIRGISITFDGQSLPLLTSVEAGARHFERSIYVFSADLGATEGTIVMDFDGVRRGQRGIMAFSVAGSDGVRATATEGVRAPGANGTVGLSVESEEGDLVLGFVAWRFSGSDLVSQSAGQVTELADDNPTRQQAHSKAGADGSTSLSVTFEGDPSTTVYLALALEPTPP